MKKKKWLLHLALVVIVCIILLPCLFLLGSKLGTSGTVSYTHLIVALRFFEGKTQTEVSSEIGISQAQVSRLEKSALKRMRKYV